MTLKEIAIRNLIRRKGKAAFILAGLAIGVCTVVAIVSFIETMANDINEKLEKYGANILVMPRSESLPLTYGGMALGGISFEMDEIRESDLADLKTIKNAANVAAVGPMVLSVVRVNQQKVLMAGVDFRSARILKPWWKVDGRFPEAGHVLMGAEAARILKLRTGDSVTVKNRRFHVSGILQPTGSQDDQLIFTRLPTAQLLLGKSGRLSLVEVAALCTACPIQDMVNQISEVLPRAKVMAIQQVVKGRMTTLAQFKKFSYGISAVVMLVGGLVVLVTMMGSVRERTGEIGIFRAIGFRKSHVMRIILMEAGLISALAGVTGYLAGLGATHIAVRFFTESGSATVPVSLETAAAALGGAFLVGLVSSCYPAYLAAGLDPNEALRAT